MVPDKIWPEKYDTSHNKYDYIQMRYEYEIKQLKEQNTTIKTIFEKEIKQIEKWTGLKQSWRTTKFFRSDFSGTIILRFQKLMSMVHHNYGNM